ncbi:MAG: Radical domain protein [Fluviicola sp.]|uniref:B12-binding domain-containing radical SAM protein n=1 Tax=Fluviicola sp. TaxID=1917219 RepID=UPI002618F3A6|nr:radical SAM protein [Fluviicola sp.]MDF3026556.1 Radical domain protein [Fluviicola sp.]
MKNQLLLVTPPFTQLNTPYPATAYLKGFLNTKNISAVQADLGIEVILKIFSEAGLKTLFAEIESKDILLSPNAERIIRLQSDYIQTIDSVILFLQGKNPSLAHLICQDEFLPEASRFNQLDELDWAFGIMGTQDKAKHLATLYLEDIADLIVETIDPHFGFSRYAERLGRSALSFDELYDSLQQEATYTDRILLEILEQRLRDTEPELIAFSVPFPGNLYAAFRSAQYIKQHFPHIKTAMGGGFPNTELRSLSDTRVFEFFDFITLDDGETPIENLIEHLSGKRDIHDLKRTFALVNERVVYINNSKTPDYKQRDLGTPDYSDLLLDQYISVIEVVNPMHRMWSDGRWNKLTMAHGCYWGKCTFCDISLDYIRIYEPATAKILCDRMEELVLQTGQNGFHFVDEAAPPALMRELALEIIRRKLVVSWWTNIRFEKSFTRDLCILLKASGCIAVSGGLEVASDRLLALIDKGVTVSQVAKVTRNFTETGIMVHAYLMYGFPTQTVLETIDSLEMVRQLFETGVLQSGFWHQFAMTAHSPVGLEPERFNVIRETGTGTFANNDLIHQDKTGIDHEQFSFGLKKSLYNFMHGIGFDLPLQSWFDFKVPRTSVASDFIEQAIEENETVFIKPSSRILWLGTQPSIRFYTKAKKGNQWEMAELTFHTRKDLFSIQVSKSQGIWLGKLLKEISVSENKRSLFHEIKSDYEQDNEGEDFEPFWYGKQLVPLKEAGLLAL